MGSARDDTATDAETFQAELQLLLQEAHDNEVDLEKSWVIRNPPGYPDWEFDIMELMKR